MTVGPSPNTAALTTMLPAARHTSRRVDRAGWRLTDRPVSRSAARRTPRRASPVSPSSTAGSRSSRAARLRVTFATILLRGTPRGEACRAAVREQRRASEADRHGGGEFPAGLQVGRTRRTGEAQRRGDLPPAQRTGDPLDAGERAGGVVVAVHVDAVGQSDGGVEARVVDGVEEVLQRAG